MLESITLLDEFLGVLRKHGVAEYKESTVHVRFYAEPTVAEAQRVIGREIERVVLATPSGAVTNEAPIAPGFSPPTAPELGAVEATRYDLNDVLHGAK